MPGMETTTNMDGEFTIEGLPVGSQATLVLEHEDHPLTYTKTHTVPDTDLDDLTFQIPTNSVFGHSSRTGPSRRGSHRRDRPQHVPNGEHLHEVREDNRR